MSQDMLQSSVKLKESAREAFHSIMYDGFNPASALCCLARLILTTYNVYKKQTIDRHKNHYIDGGDDAGDDVEWTMGDRGIENILEFHNRHMVTDLKTAIQLLQKAIELTPKNEVLSLSCTLTLYRAYYLLAECSGSQGLLEKAQKLLRALVKTTPPGDTRETLKELIDEGDEENASPITGSPSSTSSNNDVHDGDHIPGTTDDDTDDSSDALTVTSLDAPGITSTWTWNEEALNSIQEGLGHNHRNWSDRAGLLHQLSGYLTRHHMTGLISDELEEAIALRYEPSETSHEEDKGPTYLNELAKLLHLRFLTESECPRGGNAKQTLDLAINLAQTAYLALPKTSSRHADYAYDLATLLFARHSISASIDGLDRAIELCRGAVDIATRHSLSTCHFLYATGSLLFVRWCKSRDSDALNEAMDLLQGAVRGVSSVCKGDIDRIQRALYAKTLLCCAMSRFQITQETTGIKAALLEYLSKSIVRLKMSSRMDLSAVTLLSSQNDFPVNNRYLAPDQTKESVKERPATQGNGELGHYATYVDDTDSCSVKGDTNASGYESDVSMMVNDWLEQTFDPVVPRIPVRRRSCDLKELDEALNDAVYLDSAYEADVSSDDSNSQVRNNGDKIRKPLASNAKTNGSKCTDELQCAVRASELLQSRAKSHCDAFQTKGSKERLMIAIDLYRETRLLRPHGDLHKTQVLVELSECLLHRFKLLETEADLNESIVLLFTAMRHGWGHDANGHHRLAQLLEIKGRISGGKYLDLAVQLSTLAIQATTETDLRMQLYLETLARVLYRRSWPDRDAVALNIVMQIKQVLALAATDPTIAANSLRDFMDYVQSADKSKTFDSMEEKALEYCREALKTMPVQDARRGKLAWSIAQSYRKKFELSSHITDRGYANRFYTEAQQSLTLNASKRIRAGLFAYKYHVMTEDWPSARAALEAAVQLFPEVPFAFGHGARQYELLREFSHFSGLAGAVVLQANGDPFDAVHNLEAGRGVISSYIMDSYGDISTLKRLHPDIYESYRALRKEAAQPTIRTDNFEDIALENDKSLVKRYRNQLRLTRMQRHIRRKEGLEAFCLPPTCVELTGLSDRGPIVIYNVVDYRSDAILITADEGVISIPLPQLKDEDLITAADKLVGSHKLSQGPPSTKAKRQRELQDILKWLWDVAVLPVLQRLDLMSCSTHLPHIWWVTNGLMGLMPLHAAGDARHATTDCVISSYIPTLQALQHCRQRDLNPLLSPKPKMLIAAMPQTPGMCSLATDRETEAIVRNFQDMATITSLIHPTKPDVLREMAQSHMVHLACHGQSDYIPQFARLFLKPSYDDDVPEELTVEDMAGMNHEPALIAYLSACSTAETVNPLIVNEGIHIASAFQHVGFPHVIGTLWETDDKCAIQVAEIFYKTLAEGLDGCNGSVSNNVVSYALHAAVIELRKRKSKNVLGWAPFVHIGA